MSRLAGATFVLLIAALVAGESSAETVEQVQDKLMEAQKSVRSYSITMKTRENLVSIIGRVKTSGTYTYEWVRKGEGYVSRMEQTMLTEDETSGDVKKSTSKLVGVYDGEFFHDIHDDDGKVRAGKWTADIASPLDAKKSFATLREYKVLKVLPDAAVGDRDCYVIEQLNKGEMASFEKGSVAYYCKKTGIQLKSVDLNLAGEVIRERVVTDLNVNQDIPADRFVLKPPPGIEVEDHTKDKDE